MANILIVDDDYYIREMFRYFFRDSGHSAETASNGQLALDKIAGFVPDVMLLDISMPVMHGIEFLKQLDRLGVEDRRYRDIPFVVLTGENFLKVDSHYSLQTHRNCKAFLSKLTPLETVAALINSILREAGKARPS